MFVGVVGLDFGLGLVCVLEEVVGLVSILDEVVVSEVAALDEVERLWPCIMAH